MLRHDRESYGRGTETKEKVGKLEGEIVRLGGLV